MKSTLTQSALMIVLAAALIGFAPVASSAADSSPVSLCENIAAAASGCSSTTVCSVSWPASPSRAHAALPEAAVVTRKSPIDYTQEPASTLISMITFSRDLGGNSSEPSPY
jgi:hypothetical protein